MSQVHNDLKDIGLNLSFSQISSLSKNKFKAIVKDACHRAFFKELQINRQKLSKGKEIMYTKLETQSYLKPGYGLSVHEMQKIYYLRCRENYLKCNFPLIFGDTNCVASPRCLDGQDSEIHVYNCFYSTQPNQVTVQNLEFENIFKNDVPRQIEVMNIFYQKLEARKSFLPCDSPVSKAPDDPSRGGGRGRGRAQPSLGIKEAKERIALKLKQHHNENKTKCPVI